MHRTIPISRNAETSSEMMLTLKKLRAPRRWCFAF